MDIFQFFVHEFYVLDSVEVTVQKSRGCQVYSEAEIMRCKNCQGFILERRWCKYLGREASAEQRSCRSFLRIRQLNQNREMKQTKKTVGWICPEGRSRAEPSCLSKFCKWIPGTHTICPLLEKEGKKLVRLKVAAT